MASSQFEFKLMPAYGLFMMFYAQRAQHEVSLLTLQSRVAALLEMALKASQRERNVEKLVLLLANASELLAAMKTDVTLVSTSGGAQVKITKCVVTAFTAVLNETKARLGAALLAVLNEGAESSHLSNHKSSPAHSMEFLLESLTQLHGLVTECMLGPSIVTSLFASVFYYIGAAVFNLFITSKDKHMYRWDRGLLIRLNLEMLYDWAESHSLTIGTGMNRIKEAAQLLQMNLSSLTYLDSICESCPSLNSLQIDVILRGYRPAEGDTKCSSKFIESVKA
jgi:myosin heavy subunit